MVSNIARKLVLAGALSTAVLAAGNAVAADLAYKAPVRAIAAPLPTWTGFYIGGNVGYGWDASKSSSFGATTADPFFAPALADLLAAGSYPSSLSPNAKGVIGGGQIGYNWQDGSWVYGVEADGSWLSKRMTTDYRPLRGNLSISSSQGIDWLATFRGRAGLAVDRTLVYITGGVAVAGVRNSVAAVCAGEALANSRCIGDDIFLNSDQTRVGWTVGGGVEHMLTPNWTVRAEALFVDLGQTGVINTINIQNNEAFSGRFENQVVIGRVGFNYKFGGYGGPVVAAY